ncbi:MAG TPA: copper transporter [Pseudonocardia sp.]|jgi:hypothetical protein
MMTLRYHIVSLAAVLLALAVGVVLGSTNASQGLVSMVAGDRGELTNQVQQLTAANGELRAGQRSADSFAASVAPTVVKGQLSGKTVALVVAGGADPAARDSVRQLLGAAGATVTTEVGLTDAVTDPARADQLRDLTTRLLPSGAQLPTATDAGGLVGGLLGNVLMANPKGNQPRAAQSQAAAALAGLSSAGFLAPGAKPGPAQLAVVLAGAPGTGPDAAERAATMARLATELDRAGGGAVLAGGTGSAGSSGAVGVVRADTSSASNLSTVDDVQRPIGQVATVLAAREQADGRSGRYGDAPSAQGPVPGGSVG